MVTTKKEWMKTAVFEGKVKALMKDIEDTKYLTKTGVLKALERLVKECVDYEEPTFEIIKELRI